MLKAGGATEARGKPVHAISGERTLSGTIRLRIASRIHSKPTIEIVQGNTSIIELTCGCESIKPTISIWPFLIRTSENSLLSMHRFLPRPSVLLRIIAPLVSVANLPSLVHPASSFRRDEIERMDLVTGMLGRERVEVF
jgi:hypothetical protein